MFVSLAFGLWARTRVSIPTNQKIRMKTLYVLALLIGAGRCLDAQSLRAQSLNAQPPHSPHTLALSGHVMDSAAHHPIEGATIYIPQLRLGAITDRDGR